MQQVIVELMPRPRSACARAAPLPLGIINQLNAPPTLPDRRSAR
jgi:hypothetical protein